MIINETVLYANQLVEALTGNYYNPCDTVDEAKQCLSPMYYNILIEKKMFKLTQLKDLTKDYVLVEFSREENYTEHDLFAIELTKEQSKKVKRFIELELTY